MPQSLARIHLHLVFSTKHREPSLDDTIRPRLFPYLASIGRDLGCEILRVGGIADHVHLAIVFSRTITVADLVQKLKATSSVWMKKHGPNHTNFAWQAGYGVFSIGESQLAGLLNYIDQQETHHQTRTFQAEYRELLQRYSIEFDERYVWD